MFIFSTDKKLMPLKVCELASEIQYEIEHFRTNQWHFDRIRKWQWTWHCQLSDSNPWKNWCVFKKKFGLSFQNKSSSCWLSSYAKFWGERSDSRSSCQSNYEYQQSSNNSRKCNDTKYKVSSSVAQSFSLVHDDIWRRIQASQNS